MLRALLFGLLLLVASVAASAEEVISKFVSEVEVARDGALHVTETISVIAEGNEIRRGITREFPTRYRNNDGTQVVVPFEVLSVERGGVDETYSIENISNGVRVRIGSRDVLLDPGGYTYEIQYRTGRQIGFFEDHDELNWNVTGNDWRLPIERAEYHLRLPSDAVISKHEIFTGPQGAFGKDGTARRVKDEQLFAETTQRLQEGEGFTVVTAWQKGVVAPPTAADLRNQWIRDNLGLFGLGVTLALGFLYYLLAWMKVGRDPPKGVIFPQFHPPEGLGPAGVRYVWKQGFDNEAFAAALVGLAVKGGATIRDDNDGFAVTRAKIDPSVKLTRAEQAMYAVMPASELAMDNDNWIKVQKMRDALRGALDDEFDGAMFLNNFRWFVLGAVISVLGLIASAIMMPGVEGVVLLFPAVFFTIWWGVILTVGWVSVKGIIFGPGVWNRIRALMSSLFLIPFVAAGVFIPFVILGSMELSTALKWFGVAALALLLMNFIFYWLLKAPTPHGRKVLDQIEGFRMYMTTAEEDRLNKLNPPERTPELFERYLPYAMALGCENEWNDKFTKVLAAAAAGGAAGAMIPIWYSGNNWGSRGFAQDFSSGLSYSTAAAATAPGSSSGFSGGGGGGGGGSGGGGGGGGGGGW